MYGTRRLLLAAVLSLAVFVAPLGGAHEARAQLPPIDLPDLPDLPIPVPDPLPEPEESPSPTPTPEEDGAPDEEGGSAGSPAESPSDSSSSNPHAGSPGKGRGPGRASPEYFVPEIPSFDYVQIPGAYSTDGLMMAANRLLSLGWTRSEIVSEVFQPFIVGGRANWVDSWGAPRSGPGPIRRSHEGQDVFCRYGDPVLAVEPGTVAYGNGGLGGIVARLYRPGGGYWYYAHLAETNHEDFPSGSSVEAGDVIGYCGNSGNAISTPPHVHFGWYEMNGQARNPMRRLVSWLEKAEERAGLTVAQAEGDRIVATTALTAARRFGDSFVPGFEGPSGGPPVREQTLVDMGSSILLGTWPGKVPLKIRPSRTGTSFRFCLLSVPETESLSRQKGMIGRSSRWPEDCILITRAGRLRPARFSAGCPSGQRERSVKSPAYAFRGSNPLPATKVTMFEPGPTETSAGFSTSNAPSSPR